MKRTGFLTALAAAAVMAVTLGLAGAADAAVRYVKSSSRDGNKEKNAVVRSGNVRRGGDAGNVRSSSRSERQPSRSIRRVASTTPSVTSSASTSSSTRRSSSSSSSASTSRSLSNGRRVTYSPSTRSSSSVSSTPRTSRTGTQRVSSFTSRGDDNRTVSTVRTVRATTPTSTVGNVRHRNGNVTYTYVPRPGPIVADSRRRKRPRDDDGGITYARFVDTDARAARGRECDQRRDPWYRYRRRRDDDNGMTYPRYIDPNAKTADEHKCNRWCYHKHRRKRDPHCSPLPFIFIYRSGGTCIYVHSGKYGPTWYSGRWHPYRAGCQRVLYYGYWIDTRDYYYVNGLEPPWVDVGVEESVSDGTEGAPPYEPEGADGDFILKGQIRDAVIVKELSLLTTEARRADMLIRRGIVRDVLNASSQRGDSDFAFDARRGLLTLTAPSEQVAIIETMVRDGRTFGAVTELNRYGNVAAVIPVVSPFYLEQDFSGAVELATENSNALRRMLEERDWRYVHRDKECWLNAQYGTVTVVDDQEGIERAKDLMKQRPFVPREMVTE